MARVEAVFTLRDDMSSKLRSLSSKAKATETALKSLRKEVNNLIRRLDALDRKDVTISIKTVGEKRALANVLAIQNATTRLNKTRGTAKVGVEVDRGAMREIQQMSRIASNFGAGGGAGGGGGGGGGGGFGFGGGGAANNYFRIRTRVIIALFVAALGAIGPLITATQSLGLAVSGAASGVLALGGAFVALNAASGGFFSTFASKNKALNDANAALQSATTLEEAVAARKQIDEITRTLTKDEERLYKAITRTKEAYRALSSPALQSQIVGMAVGMFDLARAVMSLTNMRGFVKDFVGVFAGLQKSFKESILDPNTLKLIKISMKDMPKQFDLLARSTGHLSMMMLSLNAAATPVVTKLFEDIERGMGRSSAFRSSPEGIKRSRDFFRDMRPILDKVGGSLKNIYDNLADIGREGRGSVVPILEAFDALVDSLGTVLSAGAADFGESLAGLLKNLASAVEDVGPRVLKWLGWITAAVSNIFDAFQRGPSILKNAAGMFAAFLIFRKIVPGMRTFTNLLGKIIKWAASGALSKLPVLLAGMRIPGMGGGGGGAADTASRVGGIAVRIVGPLPVPVTMVGGGGGPGGVVTGGGKGGGGGKLGKLGTLGKVAGRGVPVIGTLLAGLSAATILSGEGPLGKELNDKQKSAIRGSVAAPIYMNRGRSAAEGVLTHSNKAATFTMGKSGQDMVSGKILREVKKLPPEMQAAGVKGAADMLKGLESKGDVAKGSTKRFLLGAREEIESFKTDLANLMTDLGNARTAQGQTLAGGTAGNLPAPSPGRPANQLGPRIRARGGVVAGTQFSMLGERGPEAVIPLTNRARRDQVMREAGLGGGAARGQRSSSPVINISGVTINSGDDMQSFVSQLENAVRRAMTNIPYADAGAMLA
jgi:hypothetical protein